MTAWGRDMTFYRSMTAMVCHAYHLPRPYMHPRQILHNGRKAR